MRGMRSGATLVCVVALLVASAGRAEADPEVARQHFDKGKEYRDQGDCTKAIPEFEKSIAAEKSIGALYNLGYCHEQLGHRQAAYEAYKQGQQLASGKKDSRLPEIGGAIATLLESPHIRLALPQPLPPGLQIKVDDEVTPSSVYQAETVIFTRPGRMHVVVVTAPGYEERRETIESKRLLPIELRHASQNAPPLVAAPEERLSTRQWVGIGLAGAGLIAEGVAVVLAVNYISEREAFLNDIHKQGCHVEDGELVCAPEVTRNTRVALTDENNSLVGGARLRGALLGAGGGVLIIAGAVLFLRAPKGAASSGARLVPTLGAHERGLSLQGTF